MFNEQNAALPGNHDEAQWISLSDLMTGLMMIFMLLAIIFMLKVESVPTSNLTSNEPVKNEGLPPMPALPAQAASNGQKAPAAKNGAAGQPFSFASIQQEINEQRPVTPVAPASAMEQKDARQATPSDENVKKDTTTIAGIPLVQMPQARSAAQQVAVSYDTTKKELYDELSRSFSKDLKAWGAEISKDDLVVRFNEPEVLFNTGDATLRPKFQDMLKEFFPRYMQIITSEKYKSLIQEVRIEGHTSSKWNGSTDASEAYFKNMELSQSRTRSTLRYVLALPAVAGDAEWLKSHLTANGLSSSHLIRNEDGSENSQLSQRVEFRIRTDADSKLDTIAHLKPAQ